MAKAKSTGKKATKAVKKVAKTKAAPSVKASAKKSSAVKAAPVKAAPKPAPVKATKPKPTPSKPAVAANKGAPADANWTDTIKAALERRHQQPDYPGAGSDSWKRAKH